MNFKSGDKVVDLDGNTGTVVNVTEWKGAHWYDVRFLNGVAVRYDSDLSTPATETKVITGTIDRLVAAGKTQAEAVAEVKQYLAWIELACDRARSAK